jgi:hypothetical protein
MVRWRWWHTRQPAAFLVAGCGVPLLLRYMGSKPLLGV